MALPLRSLQEQDLDDLEQVIALHPEMPRLVILKTDVQRRGVYYTEAALKLVDPFQHQVRRVELASGLGRLVPESLQLRDASLVFVVPDPQAPRPYLVDAREGQLWLCEGIRPLESVEVWARPDFYGRKTQAGVPYSQILQATPQALCLRLGANLKLPSPREVAEVMEVALREDGRHCVLRLEMQASESAPDRLPDSVLQACLALLKAIGKVFGGRPFPIHLQGGSISKEQWLLLREAGVLSHSTELGILDPVRFDRLHPEGPGLSERIRNLEEAVEVLGCGQVHAQIQAGLAWRWPSPFLTEREMLRRTLEWAESLAERGVSTVLGVTQAREASLDHCVRLAQGLQELRRTHGLQAGLMDYRRAGAHPDLDLARL